MSTDSKPDLTFNRDLAHQGHTVQFILTPPGRDPYWTDVHYVGTSKDGHQVSIETDTGLMITSPGMLRMKPSERELYAVFYDSKHDAERAATLSEHHKIPISIDVEIGYRVIIKEDE